MDAVWPSLTEVDLFALELAMVIFIVSAIAAALGSGLLMLLAGLVTEGIPSFKGRLRSRLTVLSHIEPKPRSAPVRKAS